MPTVTSASRLPFTANQTKLLATLAAVVALRMLGLFLVLPVFTLYGLELTHSRFLVGFAFGCYGLAMAASEIPLGRLSDRLGRRKVLMYGMSVFALGSFLCAIPGWFPPAVRIGELILGRLVQGSGAIISTAFATVAEHIEPERRSMGMAALGIPIGISFFLGVIVGPILAGRFGTECLFWLTGILAIGSVGVLAHYLPDVPPRRTAPAPLREIVRNRPLLALDVNGFLMNFLMASFFFYFPLIARDRQHLNMERYYVVLLPMMLISGLTMLGFSLGADRGLARPLAAFAFFIFAPTAVLVFCPERVGFDPSHLKALLIPGILFYIAYTGLEPILPSLVSKTAPQSAYGTSLGFFHTSQFLGSFVGGSVAGALSRLPSTYIMSAWIVASAAGLLLVFTPRRGPPSGRSR